MDQKASAAGHKAVRKIIESALDRGTSVLDEETSREMLRAYGIPAPEAKKVEGASSAVGRLQLLVGMRRDKAFGPVLCLGLGGKMAELPGSTVLVLDPLEDSAGKGLKGLVKDTGPAASLADLPAADQSALFSILQAVGRLAADHPEIVEIDTHPLVFGDGKPMVTKATVAITPAPEPKEPDRRAFKPNMAALLAPQSVVVVGASGEMSKWGGSILHNIVDGGYTGRVYAVNPKGGVFFGIHAYLNIDSLPEPPDLALLAVAQAQIQPLLHECIRKRVGAVIIMPCGSSGTAGGGSDCGEKEVARIAKEGGVTLIGPDCLGLVSNEVSLHAIGSIKLHPVRGTLSLVSQSGDMGALVAKACERRGIGIDKFASVGSEVQIGLVEVLDYLGDDPGTDCVMLCLEGLDDGNRFVEAATRVTACKPVLVLRTGLSDQAGQPDATETTAVTSSAAVWEEVISRAGLISCHDTEEMVVVGACFANLPLPGGRRVAVVGQRRGAGSLAADEILRSGMSVADLPAKISAILEHLAGSWGEDEPLDSAASKTEELVSKVIKPVAESKQVDAIILLPMRGTAREIAQGRSAGGDEGVGDPAAWDESLLKALAELMESTGKPIIPVPDSSVRSTVFDFGKQYRSLILPTARAAAQALDKMERYASREHES